MKSVRRLRNISSDRYIQIAFSRLEKGSKEAFVKPPLGRDVSSCILRGGRSEGVQIYGYLNAVISSNSPSHCFSDHKNKLTSYWVRSVQRLRKCKAIQYEIRFPQALLDELILRNYPICPFLRSSIAHAMISFSANLLAGDRLGYVVGCLSGQIAPYAHLIIHPLTESGKGFSLSNRSRRQVQDTCLRLDFGDAFQDCLEWETKKIAELVQNSSIVGAPNEDETDMAIYWGAFDFDDGKGRIGDYVSDFLADVYDRNSPSAFLKQIQSEVAEFMYASETRAAHMEFVRRGLSKIKTEIDIEQKLFAQQWKEIDEVQIGESYDKTSREFSVALEDCLSAFDRLNVTMLESEKRQTRLSVNRRTMMADMGSQIDKISMQIDRLARLKLLCRPFKIMNECIQQGGAASFLMADFTGQVTGESFDGINQRIQDALLFRISERIRNRFLTPGSYVSRENLFGGRKITMDEALCLLKTSAKNEISSIPFLSQRINRLGPDSLVMDMDEIQDRTWAYFGMICSDEATIEKTCCSEFFSFSKNNSDEN